METRLYEFQSVCKAEEFFFHCSIPGCRKLKKNQSSSSKSLTIAKEGKNFKSWQTVVVRDLFGKMRNLVGFHISVLRSPPQKTKSATLTIG